MFVNCKSVEKTHYTWFWNNAINVKLSEKINPVKIFHIIDIEKFPVIKS